MCQYLNRIEYVFVKRYRIELDFHTKNSIGRESGVVVVFTSRHISDDAKTGMW